MKRTILVTCVGGEFVYDIVRALRSAPDFDARIIGCDANPQARGRVLVDRFISLPASSEEYMAGLYSLAADEKIDLVLPLSENESRILSRHRNELKAAGVAITTSDFATVEMMTDKLTMLQRARDSGIDVIESLSVESIDDLQRALDQLGYPERVVVVKPRRTSGARGVMIFDSSVQETEFRRGARGGGRGTKEIIFDDLKRSGLSLKDLIAVAYLPGPVYDVDCIAIGGEATDIVPRLRQWADSLSPASTGNRVDMNRDVIEYCRSLCRAFAIEGAGDFDVALDNKGRPRVFDAGTRLSGSVGGAVVAGANIPAQLVRVMTGLPRQEFQIRNGCVVRPFMTFAEVPPDRQHVLF